MSRTPALIVVVVASFVTIAVPSTPAHGERAGRYRPPVDAPVADPFRAPATPYAPGNRGVEYATAVGSSVHAAGDGEVVFAGSVAGTRHVTVLHADGLRTSYSFLERIDVVRGQRVRRGDPIGTSGARLHFGVRDSTDTYLDPARLFGGSVVGRARLVPGADEGVPALEQVERAGFLRLLLEQGVGLAEGHLADARVVLHYATSLRADVRLANVITTAARLAHRQRECTPADVPVAPPTEPRVALLVGGLGSTSSSAGVDGVDTEALGYAPGDVLRFSYNGGVVPDPSDAPVYGSVARSSYDASASAADLRVAAARLEALLTDLARTRPGVAIDVFAHSQGGVVARLAIASSAGRDVLPAEVATLTTIGTPHGGADLATAAVAAGRVPGALELAATATTFDPSAPAVAQLSETSGLVARLGDLPLPDRITRRSIAARGDLVVAVPRTIDRAFPSAVVPLDGPHAHDRLPAAPETTHELALALAGRPPGCVSSGELWVDAAIGEAVSWATDAVGAATVAARGAPPELVATGVAP